MFVLADGTELAIKEVFSVQVQLAEAYCVYVHTYGDDIFYVGYGNWGRPWEVVNRNQEWWQFIREAGRYEVKIVARYHDMREAQRVEAELIILLQPVCNVMHPERQIDEDNIVWRKLPKIKAETGAAARVAKLQAEVLALRKEIEEARVYESDLCEKIDYWRSKAPRPSWLKRMVARWGTA